MLKCNSIVGSISIDYDGRLSGFGELAFGGVGVFALRIPSPSQIYFPEIKNQNIHFDLYSSHRTYQI